MIYNLVKYLKTELTTINFVCNGLQNNSTDTVVEVDEGGGVASQYIDRDDFSIRILSRALSKTVARKNVFAVYNLLHKKFGLVLPAETVESIVYPSIKAWRIVGTNLPISLGSDENGKNLFSTNFIITTQ